MSVAEILRELSKLTAAERSAVRQHLHALDAPNQSLSLHESAPSTSSLEQIESQVKQLTKAEQQELRDWLENTLEDELEMTEEFKASIERGQESEDGRRARLKAFFCEWDATHSVTVGEKPSRERTYADNPRLR